MTVDQSLLPDVRRLRGEGLGRCLIGRALNISEDQAWRLMQKAALEDAQAGSSIVLIEPRTAAEYAERIATCWRKSVEAIFEVGRLLARAKDSLAHGEFHAMIEGQLPFGARTAQRLMTIAADRRLTDATHVSHLPAAWGTLYELTKLGDETFQARIDDGTIRPDMERQHIAAAVKGERRAAREAELGEAQAASNLALPDKRYGVILADPGWRFEPRSRETGMDRAPENHYPTQPTGVIAAWPIAQIAAADSVLFLWATVPMLPDALSVMSAWGFTYRSHVVWNKDGGIGPGYWFRNQHELLLIGTRGHVPAPAPGTQWRSVCTSAKGEHSEKPDWQYDLIEGYFPTFPKIELNARRAREGWDCWGLDAPSLPPASTSAHEEAAE